MRSTPAGALLVFVVASALPTGEAAAANQAKPRIPVTWSAAPCAQIVDKSQGTTVHFEYGVGEEDVGPRTPDEVDDSRTMQFFAFGKQDFAGKPPRWISQDDIDRAAAVDPMVVASAIEPVDILTTTSRFTGDDWRRVTADDARVPITFAQAAMGVDWDVTDVPPGTYVMWGYTWEPVNNEWSARPGFVKVIDDAGQAAAAGPSVALLADEAIVDVGMPHPVPGCVDVAAGSTLTLQWGELVGSLEPQWETVIDAEPVSAGDLAIDFVAPAAAAARTVKLRAIVDDGAGHTYVAYGPRTIAVNPDAGGDAGGEAGDDGGGGGGCACAGVRASGPRGLAVLTMLLPTLVWRRRRTRR